MPNIVYDTMWRVFLLSGSRTERCGWPYSQMLTDLKSVSRLNVLVFIHISFQSRMRQKPQIPL